MPNFMDRMVSPGSFDAWVILVWVVVAAVVSLLAAVAYKTFAGRAPIDQGRSEPSSTDSPLAALEQRYARGEIDEEEFERRRATLVGGRR
jgi:putative membrane protein